MEPIGADYFLLILLVVVDRLKSAHSSRSVSTFASGVGMTATRPLNMVLDSWRWRLDDGILRPEADGCLLEGLSEERRPCPDGTRDSLPVVSPGRDRDDRPRREHESTRATSSVRASRPPRTRAWWSRGGRAHPRARPRGRRPAVLTAQPTGVFYDGAASSCCRVRTRPTTGAGARTATASAPSSRSATSPSRATPVQDLAHRRRRPGHGRGRGRRHLGGVAWARSSRTEMAALPAGTVCFDDVEDPSTAAAC